MRLIDADVFKKQVVAECIAENHDTRRASALIKLIDMQPTAFDVDNVVEQLKLLKQREAEYPTNYTAEDGWFDYEDAYNDGESSGRYSAFSKAMKIVRKGGVE